MFQKLNHFKFDKTFKVKRFQNTADYLLHVNQQCISKRFRSFLKLLKCTSELVERLLSSYFTMLFEIFENLT